MSCREREIIKVVYIDTRYVEADAKSFKAVVQKLTGKDSSIEWTKESSPAGAKTEITSTASEKKFEDVCNGRDNNISSGVSMLSEGMLFEELDGLILDLPSLEDFQWLHSPR